MPTAEIQPDLSVVLLTWNSLEITAAALESIREHTTEINYEVFAIDNGTTRDQTVTELPRRFPWVRFIANPENRGFTKATNQGIRQARGRYILLLNNDTIQTENALGDVVRYMDAHPEVGALGIMHRNNDPDKTFQPSFYSFPRPWREILGLFGIRGVQRLPVVKEQDVDWVCGSFLLIRRETLAQVGPLDERYFAYDEDIDWCLQAKRAGWKVRFWPAVSMIHLGAASAPHLRDKTALMFRSHVSYLLKNHGYLTALAYYLTTGLMLALAMCKQGLFWMLRRAKWADVQHRWQRLRNFLTLRASPVGSQQSVSGG